MKPTNIVLMVADDLGIEALGCYGNPAIKTPNLDSLANDGVCFTNAFCTTASCAASRSVILTGQHNHTNGAYGHTHGQHHFSCFDSVVSLPKLLNETGYRTGCVGKKHFAPAKVFPFQTDLGEQAYDRDDVRMSEACRDFVTEDDPFFLYWCSFDPHRGGGLVDDHPCKPNRFGNPVEAYPGDEEQIYADDEVLVPAFLNDIPEVRAELAQYYQSISRLDRGVGRLIEILKETGKYDDTMIIFISDNGPAFPEAKTTLYEPGMNLPCIVKTAGNKPDNTTCNALITWADITPTILEVAGSGADPEQFFGKSFKSVVAEESPAAWRDEIFASHTFHEISNYYPMRVVRTKQYKFIYNIAHPLTYSSASDLWSSASWQAVVNQGIDTFGGRTVDAYLHRPKFELYDLETDPGEVNNLAQQDEYSDLVDSFCEKLQDFQTKTKDPWLHKWRYE